MLNTPVQLADPGAEAFYEQCYYAARTAVCGGCGAADLQQAIEKNCPACVQRFLSKAGPAGAS